MLQQDATGLEGLKPKGGLELAGQREVQVGEAQLSSPGERGGAHELECKHGWVMGMGTVLRAPPESLLF